MEEIKKEQLKKWVSFLLIFAGVTFQQLLHHDIFCNTSLHCISRYVVKNSLFLWSIKYLYIQLMCFMLSPWKENTYIQLFDVIKLKKLWSSEYIWKVLFCLEEKTSKRYLD